MGIIKFFSNLFKFSDRLHVKDVGPGDGIYIELNEVDGGIAYVECLSNDPKTRKILIQVIWNDKIDCRERLILDYDDEALENFHLLNSAILTDCIVDNDFDSDIVTLQKNMNAAIEREEFEEAGRIQKQIDRLLNK